MLDTEEGPDGSCFGPPALLGQRDMGEREDPQLGRPGLS